MNCLEQKDFTVFRGEKYKRNFWRGKKLVLLICLQL